MTYEGFLDTCAALGFDAVELTQYYFPEESDEYLNHIKREVFARGLAVSGTAVGGNFANEDAAKRRKQIEHVKDWLVKSQKLGSACMRVFAGAKPDGVDLKTARSWVIDGLAECSEVAAKCGVILGVETHGGMTGTAAGVLALLKPFKKDPWVGLNLDFGNLTGDIYGQYRAPGAERRHDARQGDRAPGRRPRDRRLPPRGAHDAGGRLRRLHGYRVRGAGGPRGGRGPLRGLFARVYRGRVSTYAVASAGR